MAQKWLRDIILGECRFCSSLAVNEIQKARWKEANIKFYLIQFSLVRENSMCLCGYFQHHSHFQAHREVCGREVHGHAFIQLTRNFQLMHSLGKSIAYLFNQQMFCRHVPSPPSPLIFRSAFLLYFFNEQCDAHLGIRRYDSCTHNGTELWQQCKAISGAVGGALTNPTQLANSKWTLLAVLLAKQLQPCTGCIITVHP